MLSRDQLVGRYRVDAYLGSGGMATVYRVRHLEIDRACALKVLSSPRPDIQQRLFREARAQSAVRHPNVVAVHDLLDVPGSFAILMEYVEGPTLDRWLKLHDPTMAEAEALFRQVVEGVWAAHSAGLVHRDLKPSNVLLERTPGGFVAKVSDFGLAKVIDGPDDGAPTRTNVAMGTPWYMAPEQIRDAKTVDARADIFSLGCILFELLCGARSFRGPDMLSVLNAVVEGNRVDPREYVPTLPDRLVAVIDGCLQVDRERRFAHCGALLDALGAEHGLSRVRTGLGDSPESWVPDHERSHIALWEGALDDDTGPRAGVVGSEEETVPPGGFEKLARGAATDDADPPTVPPVHGGVPSGDVAPTRALRAFRHRPAREADTRPSAPERVAAPPRVSPWLGAVVGLLLGAALALGLQWGVSQLLTGAPQRVDPGVGAILER